MSLISERKQRYREAPSQAQTGFSVDTGHRRGKGAKGRGDCRPPHFRRSPTCFLGAHPRPRAPLGPAVSRQQSEAQRPWASRGSVLVPQGTLAPPGWQLGGGRDPDRQAGQTDVP